MMYFTPYKFAEVYPLSSYKKICRSRGQISFSNIQSWIMCRRKFRVFSRGLLSVSGIPKELLPYEKDDVAKEVLRGMLKKKQAHIEARASEKDFFVSVLNSAATKRDARSYIQRFTPRNSPASKTSNNSNSSVPYGVNLGKFYGPAAVETCPKFLQKPAHHCETALETKIHVAIVKFRSPQELNDETIAGIGRTLSRLGRLGLTSIVVLDYYGELGSPSELAERDFRRKELEVKQATRLLSAIENSGDTRARLVDNIISIDKAPAHDDSRSGEAYVAFPNLLLNPLKQGIILVIQPIAYTSITQTAFAVPANEIVLAITKELTNAYLNPSLQKSKKDSQVPKQLQDHELSLDRLIILDPLGGIPTTDLPHGYHVFLNMEQEFEPTKQVLLRDSQLTTKIRNASIQRQVSEDIQACDREPCSSSTDQQNTNQESDVKVNLRSKQENLIRLENLQLIRGVLSMAPKSSSAILTSPREISNSNKNESSQPVQVGTRRQINPLIHNLLTDKPIFSSSLPASRRGKQSFPSPLDSRSEKPTPTTFAKHGMTVRIHPNPKLSPWTPPEFGNPQMSLTSPEIDLSRLVYLIDDSFGRTLDVPAYLSRVNKQIAGIIVAGEYEGGAILTWESPPGINPADTTRMVPYLDKFAVLKRSQGNAGVADLIFNAIVRDCFPKGVVWRSRKNNPVNKWYFERSRGSWKLPNSEWTMFWTTPGAPKNFQLFQDYESVCRGIIPNWAG